MSEFDYYETVSALNNLNIWVPKRIKMELNTDQYIAILKGYQPTNDMKFRLFYNYQDQYFYIYRSGFVVGKYKIDKNGDNCYSFTEMYDNPEKSDCMVIFECIREACWFNHVEINYDALCEMFSETRRINGE